MFKIFSLLLLSLGAHAIESKSISIKYHEAFEMVENQELSFPDFTLLYRGSKAGKFYPGSKTRRMGAVFVFEAVKGKENLLFNWSSGTGEIGPTNFKIAGKKFVLSPYTSSEAASNTDQGKMKWNCYPFK